MSFINLIVRVALTFLFPFYPSPAVPPGIINLQHLYHLIPSSTPAPHRFGVGSAGLPSSHRRLTPALRLPHPADSRAAIMAQTTLSCFPPLPLLSRTFFFPYLSLILVGNVSGWGHQFPWGASVTPLRDPHRRWRPCEPNRDLARGRDGRAGLYAPYATGRGEFSCRDETL